MAIADSAGLPLAVSIGDGARHDLALAEDVVDAAFVAELPRKLIGDRGFDSARLAEQLRARDIELIAPKRRGPCGSKRRQDGRALRRCKRRWKVERLFAWLKRFRRIAVRWESKADNYLAFLQLGCVAVLLRHL